MDEPTQRQQRLLSTSWWNFIDLVFMWFSIIALRMPMSLTHITKAICFGTQLKVDFQ